MFGKTVEKKTENASGKDNGSLWRNYRKTGEWKKTVDTRQDHEKIEEYTCLTLSARNSCELGKPKHFEACTFQGRPALHHNARFWQRPRRSLPRKRLTLQSARHLGHRSHFPTRNRNAWEYSALGVSTFQDLSTLARLFGLDAAVKRSKQSVGGEPFSFACKIRLEHTLRQYSGLRKTAPLALPFLCLSRRVGFLEDFRVSISPAELRWFQENGPAGLRPFGGIPE